MISIKTSLAFLISFLLAVAAYFLATANFGSQINNLLPSIFVILTTLIFVAVTQLQSLQQTPQHSQDKSTTKNANVVNHAVTSIENTDSNGVATLYIGNLAYKADEHAVKEYFEKTGKVLSVRLVKDKRTGRRKGFGFIEIQPGDETLFIKKLNESEFMERNIIVRPANEKHY